MHFIYSIFITFLQYTLDIFIAKTHTSKTSKLAWYLQSFQKNHFIKFVIVMMIHYINSSFILQYIKSVLDKNEILINFKHRDIVLEFIVNILSFTMFLYFLKFKWAYVDSSNKPEITFIILTWSSILLILYTMNNRYTLKHL